MKKNTIVLFSLLSTFMVKAQEVVSTQGESYTNSSGAIDFTVGEVIINTGTNGNNTLTQGFHQTNWNFLGIEDHVPTFEVQLYPNPTSDVLNIKTMAFENVSYSLYDSKGKIVLQDNLSLELTSIQVSQLSVGTYSLTLNNGSVKLKTFKLIKSH
jgi:hypothetical protein